MNRNPKPPKFRRFEGGGQNAQPLSEGGVPCRSCGVGFTAFSSTPIEPFTIIGQRNSRGFGSDTQIVVARCATCAERYRLAGTILTAHPAMARENGNVGTDRLDAALAALDLLGRSGLTTMLTDTDQHVRDLIAALAPFGGWAAWTTNSAAKGMCGTKRWGHVSNGIWEDARLAFADLIRRRMEIPKPIEPPADSAVHGCGFCGVGTVIGKQSDLHAIWGNAHRMLLTAFGGSGSAVVSCYLCPACRSSLEATGASGLPAVWTAVIKSRGYVARSSAGVVSLSGVKPWAALPRGTKPNESPWQHVNLAALDRELQLTVYVRKVEAA
jgi:hypothetical protein